MSCIVAIEMQRFRPLQKPMVNDTLIVKLLKAGAQIHFWRGKVPYQSFQSAPGHSDRRCEGTTVAATRCFDERTADGVGDGVREFGGGGPDPAGWIPFVVLVGPIIRLLLSQHG